MPLADIAILLSRNSTGSSGGHLNSITVDLDVMLLRSGDTSPTESELERGEQKELNGMVAQGIYSPVAPAQENWVQYPGFSPDEGMFTRSCCRSFRPTRYPYQPYLFMTNEQHVLCIGNRLVLQRGQVAVNLPHTFVPFHHKEEQGTQSSSSSKTIGADHPDTIREIHPFT